MYLEKTVQNPTSVLNCYANRESTVYGKLFLKGKQPIRFLSTLKGLNIYWETE